jgi:hypothetical protein
VSFIELHLEKGLLGLAVLFMGFMAVRFLILEPNKIDFGGQQLSPRELDEALLRKADELSKAVQQAKPEKPPVPESAKLLAESVKQGLFSTNEGEAPALPAVLPIAARFGAPLPALEEGQEIDDVTLVTPLPPASVVAHTGISLAYRRQAVLPTETPGRSAPAEDDEDDDPTELSWITVAGYFPLEAEQLEMANAGYAGYRAKPYVVGLDVQRQEMTASGEFSDWVDVASGKAMPKIDVPPPAFDEKSGQLLNQADLDEKLDTVKRLQELLMQPAFYAVEAGDDWQVPPLPGYESSEEQEPADEEAGPKPTKPEKKPKPEARPQPNVAPPGGGRVGGGRMGPAGGGRMGPAGGAQNPFARAQPSPSENKGAAKKAILEDLKNARKAVKDKSWDEAQRLANSVLGNGAASGSDKGAARRILREAEKGRTQEKKAGIRTRTAGVPTPMQVPFVENPDKQGEPGVWFHDDSVAPGKTYRYRMRVKLWNRYVGRRASLRDPTQAEQTLLLGEWSLPTDPVTTAPKRHFFVRGQALGEPAASVDVFTWYKGNWLMEGFKVRVGDVVGAPTEVKTPEFDDDGKPRKEKVDFSTDAVVLDLRIDEPVPCRRPAAKGEFSYRDAKTLVLVYLDPADGQVKERVTELDKSDPLYKKLKDAWDRIKGEL